ncbi:MAG: SDR family oxidoreductase [Hyphomicrobiales bacterium]|jgi:NAD(P)-dependent dehydrogenase (short-subunit alcohol dehydrogenase family)|nr:SDR family oxidoreductase [Hyphomicrobiales bacterium]
MTSGGRLAQRVALVTGGGGEIGGAICRRFAAEGAEVAIADLDPAKSAAVARAIAGGGRALALEVDVADEASAKDAVERTIASFGRLTTLVNVAATVTPDGTVETLSLDDWNKAIAVNLTGAFVMCKYAVPELRRAGGGSIINIASQLGHLGVPLRSPYCTTKAALIHFTRILAMDHAVDKIRANTISPGFILTERSSRRSGGKERARAVAGPRHLLNRPGEPEEIAAGAVYLASDDAAFVTATDLLIDGGYIAFKGRIEADGRPAMI